MFDDVVVKEKFMSMMRAVDAISEFIKETKVELQELKQEFKELKQSIYERKTKGDK